jgi:hypothetical protein
LDTYFHQLRAVSCNLRTIAFSAALKIPMLSENLEWFELRVLFCPVQNGDFHPF